jgi:hypothetical protein
LVVDRQSWWNDLAEAFYQVENCEFAICAKRDAKDE